MRRIFAFLSVPILLLIGIGTATSAMAVTTIDGGTLTSGKSVKAAISVASQDISYTFAGTNGGHVTFDVTASNWGTGGSAKLYFYSPTNVFTNQCTLAAAATYCDLTPTSSGNWKVTLHPLNNAVGSSTFTYATDVNGGALTGSAVTTALPFKGQKASYTIAATSGVPLDFNLTASNWGTGGTAYFWLYPPNSTTLYDNCQLTTASPLECTLYPNVTGNWTVVLDPQLNAVGSATFTAVSDQIGGALTVGKAVTTKITTPGQSAGYTFTATADKHTTIDIPATNWGTGGSAKLYLYSPATPSATHGVLQLICPLGSTPTYCEFTPSSSSNGTWRAVIDPQGQAVGSATMTLATDINGGVLTAGKSVAATLVHGQGANYTFAATAGSHVTFDVTATNWGTGDAYFGVFDASNTGQLFCKLTTAPRGCDFTPDSTGTYKVLILPENGAAGSLAFTYATDLNKGVITPGTPVTTAIANRGQNATYTFNGSDGDLAQIDVSASNWGPEGAWLWFYEPGSSTAYDHCVLGAGASTCTTQLDMSGTWRLSLDPVSSDTTGSATFKLSFPPQD
jgi:hypothetical protein